MRTNVFIVRWNDGLLRALTGILASEHHRVRTAETIDELLPELDGAGRPAILVIDEESTGPEWRERLDRVPADVPCVLLTWYPWSTVPPRVTPLGKPFRARELMDLLDALAATERAGPGAGP